MKTKIIPKSTTKRKVKKQSITLKKRVSLAHPKKPVIRHFRLIEHKHTFKLIHHRHTSHLSLALVLTVVGFFIYASNSMAQAVTSSGTVTIGAIVPGPPPLIGATITSPKYGDKLVGDPITKILGNCQPDTFVTVRNNGLTIGSINCTSEGTFNMLAQLSIGKNILTAFNYDNMNQPGPVTPEIEVFLASETDGSTPTDIIEKIPEYILEVIPDNPSIITGVSKLNDCSNYNPGVLPTGGVPHVSIVCVPRLFFPGIQHHIGVVVWGGQPPYALSVNWGKELSDESAEQTSESGEDTLLSIDSPGYKLLSFNYVVPDTYRVMFKLKDNQGEEAIIQTAIQVNGQAEEPKTPTITSTIQDIFTGKSSWFESPVPFYLLAVAITLGFWCGDIFDRKFGAGKILGRRKRRTA